MINFASCFMIGKAHRWGHSQNADPNSAVTSS
jgi:hypothetical protein